MTEKLKCIEMIANSVLTLEEIRNEGTWQLETLSSLLSNTKSALIWCARRHLIKNSKKCTNCQNVCVIRASVVIDGYRWACPNCPLRKSLRDNSIFFRSHLSIGKIVILIYCWCTNMTQTQIQRECNIRHKSIYNWIYCLRRECTKWINSLYGGIGGSDDEGEPIIVEIDKTNYFYQIYHPDLYEKGYWTLSGVERKTGRCFFAEMTDHNSKNIIECVTKNILPGSHIISNEWISDVNLAKIDDGIYEHSIVNDEDFVDPDDSDIHTQTIQNMWMMVLKAAKKWYGPNSKMSNEFFTEFMFRRYYKSEDIFKQFLILLIENYA